jgi:alkaline phosphatase
LSTKTKPKWNSPEYTNSLMVLSAKGDAARLFHYYADEYDPVRGWYLDNTELAKLVFWALDPQ